ncbi:MAG TPA: MotA/TolQ/ExbB proton channel family protein [Beijerinckiaceae bacterium]|nr:MotA/TolQ/ExbB proton channel family protein [Beijerinckiaceae bacterium]
MTIHLVDSEFPADRMPMLRWLTFTGICVFGFVMAWEFGLFRLMLTSDKTHISLIITFLYIASTVHCFLRTNTISRELDTAYRLRAIIEKGATGFSVAGQNVLTSDGVRLPPGRVTTHIRNLVLKAHLESRHRIDQTLLLRGLADDLRGPNYLGSFASDTLMKLGLLGTIVGFILMLAPIAGLDAADHASVKSSMGLMSDGMAVAMYTTLTGLIGSILIKTQYYMLDQATAKLFAIATDLTEVFVVSVLERQQDG